MKKNLKIIIPTIILIIIIILITLFITNMKKESKLTQEKIEIINETYQKLETNIQKYNQYRNNLSNQNTSYYEETFTTDYQNMIKTLEEYELIISNITENITSIDNNCKNQIFNNSKTNTICQNYKKTYEKIVNIYINDINNFNNIVTSYNDKTNSNLEKFTTKNIKDYIDYDKDGEYLERK